MQLPTMTDLMTPSWGQMLVFLILLYGIPMNLVFEVCDDGNNCIYQHTPLSLGVFMANTQPNRWGEVQVLQSVMFILGQTGLYIVLAGAIAHTGVRASRHIRRNKEKTVRT